MRFRGLPYGLLVVALSSPLVAQTTNPTKTVSLAVGSTSSLTFGPSTPPCSYTGTATGYNTSIVSATVTTGTGTISIAFQGLSAGSTTVMLNVTGTPSSCSFTQPISTTVTASSSQAGTVITVPALPGGGYAPQFFSDSYPPGCAISVTTSNPNPGVATISPTSYQNASGSVSFTINGVSAGTDNIALTITVTGCSNAGTTTTTLAVTVGGTAGVLQIPGGGGASQVTLPAGTVNMSYSDTLPASGGTAPYTWSLLGGALPAGLSLSSSGVISGVPTQAGMATFTAQVAGGSSTASSIFVLTVASAPLIITTASALPSGIVNTPYPPQVVSAAGGTPPYTFQATGLPAGLTLTNGAIGGTPTAAGNPTATLTVTDSGNPALSASSRFPISINPARTDLLLSQTTVSFSLASGAAGVPPAQRVSVQSNTPSQLLNYSVSAPAVPWLTATSGTTTPGALNLVLNSQALALTATAQTSLTVTCVAPSPCAGNAQTVTVNVNVSNPPPQLTVTSASLSFTASSASPQPVAQTLGIQNTGGGTITVNSVTSPNSSITITGVPATIAAGPPVLLTVTLNPAGLSPGVIQSSIVVKTSAGTVTVPVTVVVSSSPSMTLNPSGALLQETAGALPGNPNGSFEVSVTGATSINWTATLLPGASWLTLNTASGTSTPSSPGTVTYTINSAAPSLAPQAYYAAIQVASASVVDTPLTYIVVLNVSAANVPPTPFPEPAGLLFTYGGSAPSAQTIAIYASSATPQTYQVAPDSSWLVVSRSVGQTSSAAPGMDSVTVNPGSLAAGVYTGTVSYSLAGAAVRSVNATLIVESGAPPYQAAGESPRAAGCTPAHLVPTQTGLVNSFAQPVAWPVPLNVLLANDCGQPVTNGQVVATFSNGDPPLILTANDTVTGTYTGTWTPGSAAQQVTITATASATGFPAASAVISGQVTPNSAPLLTPSGTLNAFAIAAEPGVPLAPGTIVQIYGSNLAAQTTSATAIPLPTSLNQTSVIIGGISAPLYFVSPGQINAQVPFELTAGNPYQVLVNANNALSTPSPIQLASDSPGIAQIASGQVIAQHLDFSLVTEASPAKPGEIVMIYVAGMGLTNQTVPSGTASPQANVLDAVTLTLGGAPVTSVIYAGLTPTVVGLYQIDFQVPATAPNGDLPLVLTQTSGVSNSSIVPVHN